MSDYERAIKQFLRQRPSPIARSHIGPRAIVTRELGYETRVYDRDGIAYTVRYDTHEDALRGHRAVCERIQDGDLRFLTRLPAKKKILRLRRRRK
jgi:hypothetical protein